MSVVREMIVRMRTSSVPTQKVHVAQKKLVGMKISSAPIVLCQSISSISCVKMLKTVVETKHF